MTQTMRRINAGGEGIIYSLNDDEILKVYRVSLMLQTSKAANFTKNFYGFNTVEELIKDKFSILDEAYKLGLKVPKPFGIEVMTLEEIYDRCGRHNNYVECVAEIDKKHPEFSEQVRGQLIYGLRKQFIPGKPLNRNFIPSLKLKHLVQKTYSEFYDAGIIIHDARPSNYVLNSNGLYVIDEGSLEFKDDLPINVKREIWGFHTYYGDKLLMGYYMLDGWVQHKLHEKMMKKGIIEEEK
jgi:hypothetical protein